MTTHEKFIADLEAQAKKAGRPLGPQATAAKRRPVDYVELSPRRQWEIDANLGILDWEGTWNT